MSQSQAAAAEQPVAGAVGAGTSPAELARTTLKRATSHLLGLQHAEGWWQGELETNVTMDAEDLLFREFLGVRTAEQTDAAARWIRSCQRADGTWANFRGGDARPVHHGRGVRGAAAGRRRAGS